MQSDGRPARGRYALSQHDPGHAPHCPAGVHPARWLGAVQARVLQQNHRLGIDDLATRDHVPGTGER